MNCIYCHLPTINNRSGLFWDVSCPDCQTYFFQMTDEFIGVSINYWLNNSKYSFNLNIAENYTSISKDGKYITAFSGLLWIFPQNVQEHIHRFNKLIPLI